MFPKRQFSKLLTFLLVMITAFATVHGQSIYSRNDSVRVWSYLSRADMMIEKSQFDSALNYSKMAIEESVKLKLIRGEGYASLKTAEIYTRKSEYLAASNYDSAALKAGLLLKDTVLIALSYFQLGQYLSELKKYKEAEQLFMKALVLKFEQAQNENTAFIYNDLGSLYGNMGSFEKQVEWYLKAVRLHQQNKNDYGLAQTYSNLNDCYYELDRFNEALKYGKISLQLRERIKDYSGLAISCNNLSQTYLRIDSVQQAVYYQELGLKYAELSGLNSRLAHSYVSMSLLMNRQKKFQEALSYEKKAIEIYETVDKNVQANRFIAAAYYSNILNDSAGAVAYFIKSEMLSKNLNNKVVLRNVYFYLSEFYKNHKNGQLAYEYYKKHILYRDSLNNSETATKIATLQTQFETEKKDFEINRLNTLQRIKQLEIEKQKAIISGNTLEALQKQNEIDLLSKSRELQEEQLKQQAVELERQQLVTKNNKQQLQLAEKEKQIQQKQISNQKQLRNFLIGGLALFLLAGYLYFNRYQLKKKLEQQKSLLAMRNNISENLHDDIGASLSNIGILNELAKRNLATPSKSTEYLNKAGEDIQRISESISDIVWNINPKYDELKNLFVRMKRYAADMMDGKNISYEMNFSEEAEALNLSMEKRRNFYLIFKEAVNNLVKYSQAEHAVINVSTKNTYLHLLIKDDGKGFDVSEKSAGNGLHNMQKRAADMNGIFSIQSIPGKGTEIELDIPIT